MHDTAKWIKENSVDDGYLHNWCQSSVMDNPPTWTDKHIAEICSDFYLIPKEAVNNLKETDNKARDLEVSKVKVLEDRKLLLTFSNRKTKIFDGSLLVGPAYKPLLDSAVFNSCTLVDGVVTWANETIDCSPEFMYIYGHTLV